MIAWIKSLFTAQRCNHKWHVKYKSHASFGVILVLQCEHCGDLKKVRV